jgi:hypothetical protein
MSLILNGNGIIQGKSIGYEIVDDPILTVTYSVETWERPTDWISVPTPATGSEIVSMLVGVYENVPNFLNIQASATFSIDWGDGSTQSVSSGSYARKEFSFGSYSAGTLTSDGFRQALVIVTPQVPGTFTSFDINGNHSYQSTSYRPNVLEIKMSGPNLTSISLSTTSPQLDKLRNFEFVGTHSVTNFSYLFNSCEALRKVKIDCNGVTNTSFMFQNCSSLREIDSDFTKLNLVTTMASMFSGCVSLNTFPTLINASSCTSMSSMFASCYSLQESPIFINTSNVTNTSSMFSNCTSLYKVNGFTSSSVTDMSFMFYGCYLLQNIPLFDTRWVTNFSYMFSSIIGSGRPMLIQSVPELNTASASNMSYMFNECRSLVSDRRTRGIPFFDTSRVTNMSFMFQNCFRVKSIPEFDTRWVTNFQSTFAGCILLSEVPLLNTASASRMDNMFLSCRVLQTVPFFNTQNVTNFSSMFRFCFQLNEVPNFNMATASDVSYMFDCLNTTDTSNGSLYTVPNFNFSSTVTQINMLNFLSGQRKLSYVPQFNTTRVNNMSAMFYGCYELKEVPTLDMSLVTTTNTMFRSCFNLRKVGNLNMPVNTDMRYMFYNCYNLQTIDNIFTTTSLTLVREAFRYCYKIRQIPQFNTSNVSTGDNGFFYTFSDCQSLTSAPGLTTSNVRVFQGAFQNCHSLKVTPSYDTSLASDMSLMHDGCLSLEQVPTYNISNVTSLAGILRNCYNITSVTFSNISTTNNVSIYYSFQNCTKLRTISMPGIRITQPARAFDGCTVLTSVGTFSVPSVPGSIGDGQGYYRMFTNCSQLLNLGSLTFSGLGNDYREMFSGCNSLVETPYFSLTASGDVSWQTSIFSGCNSLSKINVTDNKFNLSFQGCNLDYNNILSEITSFQNANLSLSLSGYRTINFLENPGLPEMMNFWKRNQLYDKGYTYSSGTYNWTDLRMYVQAGDTYSYTGTGTTFSDISGWTYIPNVSPTFSVSNSTSDGALLNSPIFNTNYFEFDGLNEAINFGTSSVTLLSTVTLFAVIEPLALPSGATVSIFGRYGASGEDNYFLDFTNQRLRFGFKQSGASTRRERILNRTFNVGQKYFVAARHQSAANSCLTWVDAVSETSYFSNNITSETMDQTSSSILSIAGNVAANSSYANIRVYAAGIYNRLLSQEQIEELQSFFRRQGIL